MRRGDNAALTTSSAICCVRSACNTAAVFSSVLPRCAARGIKYSPFDSIRKRPTQSPSEKKRDAQIIFPRTLKSGRPEQESTVAQKLYDKQFAGMSSVNTPDRRFFRPLKDYTEIQDGDPYAPLFGESKATADLRVRHWQRQFEEENAHVELPYERTSMLRRSAPNWFIRYFLNMRDTGGLNHTWHLAVFGVCVLLIIATVAILRTPTRSSIRDQRTAR